MSDLNLLMQVMNCLSPRARRYLNSYLHSGRKDSRSQPHKHKNRLEVGFGCCFLYLKMIYTYILSPFKANDAILPT